jgi:hypothetical protein
MNIFQASWEMFSRNSLECPISNHEKNILKNIIINLSANFLKILSQNNKKILIWGLSARPKC